MPQLARWLAFIEQFDYEVIHRPGIRHGNADGLSRRPPEDDTLNDVRVLRKQQSDMATALVGESLSQRQQTDTELGTVVGFRLSSDRPPTRTSIQSESELTKKLVTKWNRLCVENGLVYLKDKPAKKGESSVPVSYTHLTLPTKRIV